VAIGCSAPTRNYSGQICAKSAKSSRSIVYIAMQRRISSRYHSNGRPCTMRVCSRASILAVCFLLPQHLEQFKPRYVKSAMITLHGPLQYSIEPIADSSNAPNGSCRLCVRRCIFIMVSFGRPAAYRCRVCHQQPSNTIGEPCSMYPARMQSSANLQKIVL
jgi:hypothetical protein